MRQDEESSSDDESDSEKDDSDSDSEEEKMEIVSKSTPKKPVAKTATKATKTKELSIAQIDWLWCRLLGFESLNEILQQITKIDMDTSENIEGTLKNTIKWLLLLYNG